jgi:hypothetical protein
LSATQAAGYAAALTDTSTSSVAIGIGAKTFTVSAGKQFIVGEFLTIANTPTPTNFMQGQVTSYSGTTLVMSILNTGGSGTYSTWTISPSGVAGPTGSAGTIAYGVNANGTSGDVITVTIAGPSTADGTIIAVKSTGANTSTTPTLNLNANGAQTVTTRGGKVLLPGDVGPAGFVGFYEYRASSFNWELMNPVSPNMNFWGGTAGGTANAVTVTTTAALTAASRGMIVSFVSGATANTGAVTLAVDSISAVAVQAAGAALTAGKITASTTYTVEFDGTYWQLAGGGGASQASLQAVLFSF